MVGSAVLINTEISLTHKLENGAGLCILKAAFNKAVFKNGERFGVKLVSKVFG